VILDAILDAILEKFKAPGGRYLIFAEKAATA
jgi:hypothetical protein